MDPIGAAASLVTLIALAKEIAVRGRNLWRRYRDTAQALVRVREQVLQLEVQLNLLSDLQEQFVNDKFLSKKEFAEIQDILSPTHSTLLSIRDFLKRHAEDKSRYAQVR